MRANAAKGYSDSGSRLSARESRTCTIVDFPYNLGMARPSPDAVPLPLADPDAWSALMARAQAGDAAAYRHLLIAITPYLRSIASRAHRSQSDVEDSVQDILLTLHTVRHTYDPARPFKPWLAGIARHRLVDRLRVLGRRAIREVVLDAGHETFPDPGSNNETAPDHHTLRAALQSLPAGQRRAIEHLKLQELSLKEASERTGMSIAALKVATHRGIKTLRRLLGQPEENE